MRVGKVLEKQRVPEPRKTKTSKWAISCFIIGGISFVASYALWYVAPECPAASDLMSFLVFLSFCSVVLGCYFLNPHKNSLPIFKSVHKLFIFLFALTAVLSFTLVPSEAKSIGVGITAIILACNSGAALFLVKRHRKVAISVFRRITFYPIGTLVLFILSMGERCLVGFFHSPLDEKALLIPELAGQFLVPLAIFQEAKELWDAFMDSPSADVAKNTDACTSVGA